MMSSSVATIRKKAEAAPRGSCPALVNWMYTMFPTKCPGNPATQRGSMKEPRTLMNMRMEPVMSPGKLRGKVTLRKARKRLAPRS